MSTATVNSFELDELLRQANFPEVDHPSWRGRVDKELGDANFDEILVSTLTGGMSVEPLFSADSAAGIDAGLYLGRAGGRGPRIVEEIGLSQPDLAAAIAAGRRLGVEVTWLKAAAIGTSSDVEALRDVLRSEGAETVIEVEEDLVGASQIWTGEGEILACDPLADIFDPSVDGSLKALASTRLIQDDRDAAVSPVHALAFTIAAGAEALRRFAEVGASAAEAASRVLLVFHTGDDLFLEIAKLRAARRLWRKILGAIGAESADVWIHARESRHGRSVEDPRSNLLRSTVRCFAASVGGADTVAVNPFDDETESPSAHGRRLAILTQQILALESHLGEVADPAGGSWYLETLTDRLARAAWARFQELEGDGGIAQRLKSGREEVTR